MTEKKAKKEKKSGGHVQPIKFFSELAINTQDVEEIKATAKKEDYSETTISIQIGRLRTAGLLPPKEKKERVVQETRSSNGLRAVPKPGKKKKAA